jgi:hypothetical protein
LVIASSSAARMIPMSSGLNGDIIPQTVMTSVSAVSWPHSVHPGSVTPDWASVIRTGH